MRLSTVELRRFGRYEQRTVSFTGDAGMYVLYGPNEAGKTTLLNAITYALHGMPKRGSQAHPDYGFQYSLPSLRIGMTVVRDDGTTLDFVRKRGNKDTVLDSASDAAAPDVEARLAGTLAGVPQDVWLSKHSLSRQRLRDGAQALLESGGDAADALFGAATGVTVVRRVRDQVRKQRQALLSDAGSAGELHAAIKAYEDAKKRVRAAELEAAGYDDDVAARDAIEADRARAAADLAAAERLVQQLTHVIDAGAMLAERDRLERERESSSEPSFTWTEREHAELDTITRELPAQREVVQSQRTRIDTAKDAAAKLVTDPRLLAARGPVTDLLKRLEKVGDARAQLPGLEAAVIAAQRQLDSSATAAGIERAAAGDTSSVRAAIPARAARDALAVSADDGAKLEQTRTAAHETLDAARAKLKACERELVRLGVDGVESGEQLSTLIEQAQAVGTDEHRTQLAQIDSRRQALEHRASALAGCTLDLDGVRSLALPPATEIAALDARFTSLDERRTAAQRELDLARQHLPEHRAALAQVEQGEQIADPAELTQLRAGRDELWQQVRTGLSADEASEDDRRRAAESVPGYEQAIGVADRYADDIARDGERVGAASRIRTQIADDEQRERDGLAALAQVEHEQSALQNGEWRSLWASAGIEASSRAAMQDLVRQVEAIRDDAIDLDELVASAAAKRERIVGLVHQLQTVLAVAADKNDLCDGVVLDVLEQQARTRRGEAQRQTTQHTKLTTARDLAAGEVEQADDAVTRAGEQLADWQLRWASLCREVELADDATIETARLRIDAWQQLATALDELDAAQDNAGAARQTIDAFSVDVAALLAELSGIADGIDASQPEFAVNQLDQLASDAAATAGKHEHAVQRHAELVEELAQQQSDLDALERRSTLLDEHAVGIDRQQLLVVDAEWVERCSLTERIAALDAQILDQTRMQVAELVTLRDGRGDDELVAARAALGEQVTRLTARREELRVDEQQVSERIGSIISSGTLADALQDRANALATVERLVPEVRSLALQEQLLVDFLEELASREMGPVVELAGEYFHRLTCGAYDGLVVEPADDGTLKLRARAADGRDPVSVDDGLSEGTRDQLYLALRLATLVTGLDSGAESMPLVVDDILLTFDDARSTATLELLAELSQRMQIVFLTHHRRLVDLARDAIDEDHWQLVELGAVAVG